MRVGNAHVSVADPSHPRDHADIDHGFGRMTALAQDLTVLQRGVLR